MKDNASRSTVEMLYDWYRASTVVQNYIVSIEMTPVKVIVCPLFIYFILFLFSGKIEHLDPNTIIVMQNRHI